MGYRRSNLHALHMVVTEFPAVSSSSRQFLAVSCSFRMISNTLLLVSINLGRLGTGCAKTEGNCRKLQETVEIIGNIISNSKGFFQLQLPLKWLKQS